MKAVLQRVSSASVSIADRQIAHIDRGLVVLLGIALGDTGTDADSLADKIAGLRIFEDSQGKLNLSLPDVGGQALVVSNFTLLADTRKGRRPSFTEAAPPAEAEALYYRFVVRLREQGLSVATGQFQQHMVVELANDGPVTLLLDSRHST